MNEKARSEQICPVCHQHTLAVDELPQIDVLGVQPYSDIVGMGDVHATGAIGIVCLSCGTRWTNKDAFDRGEPETELEAAQGDESGAEAGGESGT
jgi:hypothetical protein